MRSHHDEGPPCRYMESLLQQVADGTLTGWRKWYALAHAAKCRRCGDFLSRLQLTLEAVRASKDVSTSDESLERLRAKIRDLDRGANP